MIRVRRKPATLLLLIVLTGCGNAANDYSGPQRYALSGKVMLNGAPLQGGTISFIAPDEYHNPCGAPIVGGQYTIPEPQGANEGQYRVEIRWLKLTGRQHRDEQDTGEMVDEVEETIPAKYNARSTLTADVSASATTFDFVDLTSN